MSNKDWVMQRQRPMPIASAMKTNCRINCSPEIFLWRSEIKNIIKFQLPHLRAWCVNKKSLFMHEPRSASLNCFQRFHAIVMNWSWKWNERVMLCNELRLVNKQIICIKCISRARIERVHKSPSITCNTSLPPFLFINFPTNSKNAFLLFPSLAVKLEKAIDNRKNANERVGINRSTCGKILRHSVRCLGKEIDYDCCCDKVATERSL